MSWKAKLYLVTVYLAGLWVIIWAFLNVDKNLAPVIILWVIIGIPFEFRAIRLSTDVFHTLAIALYILLIIVLGYWAAIIVAVIVSAIFDLLQKKGAVKLFFNVGQIAVSIFLAGQVFYLLKRSSGVFVLPDDLLAFISASLVYNVVNNFLVAAVVSLTTKRNILHVIKTDFKMVFLFYSALAPMSMQMVLLYNIQPFTIVLILPLLALAHTSLSNYFSLKAETRKTLEALADFVDCKDRYTAEHSRRVTGYAGAIAEEMGIDDAVKDLIELAGRVHDLGKIAVSDSILLSPKPLTDSEVEAMQTHPDTAYNILKSLNMYRMGSVIVREHHERYDGNGYPQGLESDKIHIGARILAVADAYDAMTSDRPYRKAMSEEEAIGELRKNAGTQFDPAVVEAFINVLAKKRGRLEVN
ncbi:MAG: HD-GYP domain-containing protein [Peptococcaceae bacterium]|nr:HD-GYP domain-containing protein [Peptococcaceae bacterium]